MKQADADQEPSSQEVEDEVPENLAEEIAAARKRVADSEDGE